jgi:hypothetical protein
MALALKDDLGILEKQSTSKLNLTDDLGILESNAKPSLSASQLLFNPLVKTLTGKSVAERTDWLNKYGNQLENKASGWGQPIIPGVTQQGIGRTPEGVFFPNPSFNQYVPELKRNIQIPSSSEEMFRRQLPAAIPQGTLEFAESFTSPFNLALGVATEGLVHAPVAGTTVGAIAKTTPLGKGFIQGVKELGTYEQALKGMLPTSARVPMPTSWNPLGMFQPKQLSEAEVDAQIKQRMNKAIRPSVAGKQDLARRTKFEDRSISAIKDIVANKSNNQFRDAEGNILENDLPENLLQHNQAIQQGLDRTVQQYSALAKQAGKEGAEIDLEPYISKLDSMLKDNVFKTEHPADYAKVQSIRDGFSMREKMTPLEAQDKIAEWNADLAPAYKGGFKYGSQRAQNVVRELTGQLRKDVDSVITNATGEEYQPLKNLWGAYKGLVKDSMNRYGVDVRKNPVSIWNFLDSAGSGEMVYGGLETMIGSPYGWLHVARGLALKGGRAIAEYKNDPNRMIKGLYKYVSENYTPQQKGVDLWRPIGELGNKVESPKFTLGNQFEQRALPNYAGQAGGTQFGPGFQMGKGAGVPKGVQFLSDKEMGVGYPFRSGEYPKPEPPLPGAEAGQPFLQSSWTRNAQEGNPFSMNPFENVKQAVSIPEFKNTEDALVFGYKNKDNPGILNALQTKRDDMLAQIKELKAKDPGNEEILVLAQKAQLPREALEAASGKITPEDLARIKKKMNNPESGKANLGLIGGAAALGAGMFAKKANAGESKIDLDKISTEFYNTEGLLPGQTPLMIDPKNRYKDTIQGIPIDWDAYNNAPEDRKNFYFVKPDMVKEVIKKQLNSYIMHPRRFGLTADSTLEDIVNVFDRTNPKSKIKALTKAGIDLKTTIKEMRNK